MTIKDHPDGKLIILSKPFDNPEKFIYTIYFCLYFTGGILFLYLGIRDMASDNIIIGILFSLLPLLLISGAYSFINKATISEYLIVNRNSITIAYGGIFTTRKYRYEVRKIENFRHLIKQPIIPHQFEGQSIDYLVQTRKLTSKNLKTESKAAFDYKGYTIELNKDIYTWEFNELAIALYDITKYDFQIPNQLEKIATGNDVEP